MNKKNPHIVQYQGSKRILAPQILKYMPFSFDRLIEPFSGMAAISIAVAQEKRTNNYIINDINKALINLFSEVVESPQELINRYTKLWENQFLYGENHIQHYYFIREKFNQGDESSENMLYLLARCVKGAVRYSDGGKFNQSPDKRRHGTNPKNMEYNVNAVSGLLKGKCRYSFLDYKEIFEIAKPGDLLYIDPPYQGVSNVRDKRYYSGVSFDEFTKSIDVLNRKGVSYIISYDGKCGSIEYGNELPTELGCEKIMLNAGFSSQSILLGKKETTFESLYISSNLKSYIDMIPKQLPLMEAMI